MTRYASVAAAVRGGQQTIGVWNPDSDDLPTILAIHGITASHRAWPLVADRLGGLRMIAPDLRGRGRSNTLPPPWGLRDHADDLARVLDHFGIEHAVVLGHSMGAFVAVRLADQHPDRVSAVVMVDGGLPLPTLDGVPAAELPTRLLGPAGERLKQTFGSRSEYMTLWREHPALLGHWSDSVADYADYDLEEVAAANGSEGPTVVFRSASNYAAVAANIVQLSGDDGYADALADIRQPVSFVRAPRGLLNEVPPLYSRELVRRTQGFVPGLEVSEAHDVNHYTIVMSPKGADQVAALTRAAVAKVSP